MAWGSVGNLGQVQSKAANQASLTLTTLLGDTVAGSVVVLVVAVDNNQTTDGDEGAVSSVQDTQGNTYTKAKEFCNGQGAAQAGATVSMWFSKLTTALTIAASDTITANFSSSTSRDASALTAWNFTISAGNVVSVEGSATQANDGVDPSAITISGLTSQEYLWVHGLAAEGPNTDAYTWDADYTQFSGTGTTGGGAASNMHLRGGFRIFTGTTDTVDVTSTTADRDYAQAYVALKEAAPPPPGAHKGLSLLGVGH